jgi:hypothetical protein
MKNKHVGLFLVITFALTISFSADGQIKKAYRGNWVFYVPYAEPGYTSGYMELKKDSIITFFVDNELRYPSIGLKVENDSVIWRINVDGVKVTCLLLIENKKLINGRTYWYSGNSSLILTKKKFEIPKI